jgi:threonine synthase
VQEPPGEATPLHVAGGTPVFGLARLAEKLGLKNLWLKDESRNPTASFKDRASAIVVTRAHEINAEIVVTASTGNAGAALAGMSAAVGQKAIIFAPKSAPQAKVAQLLIFGAKVILVDGTYDDAFDLTVKASREFGWYCRNTGYNPFTAEGKKTAAFEIWEWWEHTHLKWHEHVGVDVDHAPLTVFVSVGVADSISVDLPRDGVRAVRAAKETEGTYVNVSDEEILNAIAELGKLCIFVEPAGATAYAGLVKAAGSGVVGSEDPILVLNTGSGLKDVRAAMQAVEPAPIIEPSLKAVKKLL